MHEALREQAASGHARSLGDILVARGWVRAIDITRCVEEQAVVVVSWVMAAERGSFVYAPGVAAPARVGAVPLDTQRVLMEATRRVDELASLRAQFPNRYAPLAPSARSDVTIAALTPAEERVLAALHAGADSLAELEDLLPTDEPSLLRTLVRMRDRGLLVAGHGAPGGDLGVASAPPPSEEDLSRLVVPPSPRPVAAPPTPVATAAD